MAESSRRGPSGGLILVFIGVISVVGYLVYSHFESKKEGLAPGLPGLLGIKADAAAVNAANAAKSKAVNNANLINGTTGIAPIDVFSKTFNGGPQSIKQKGILGIKIKKL